MQLSLELEEYIVFDFETTGLSPWAGDEVIEIGAMKVIGSSLCETEVFHTLVNPRCPIPPESVQVHGITNEMVKDAPFIEEVLPAFLDFIEGGYLVAQNARFDMSFFTNYLAQLNVRKQLPVYDTLALSRKVFPHESHHNLDVIAQRLGIAVNPQKRHRSLEDVKITALAFIKLKERLADNWPEPEIYSL